MDKVKSAKSALVLSVLIIGLSACSQPRRNEVTRTPVYNRASERPEVCNSCGVVSSVTAVEREGRGTGAGAAIGAVVGGLIGHQVGGGTGKQVATVAGVIGGAVVGNNVEENRNDESYYEITVDMDRGGAKTFDLDYSAARGIGVGSRVSVFGNTLTLR